MSDNTEAEIILTAPEEGRSYIRANTKEPLVGKALDIVEWLRAQQIASRQCGDEKADRYGEAASLIEKLRGLIWRRREISAQLVEEMIDQKRTPGERVALAVAARAIRRGRHLTDKERVENLFKIIKEG